MSRDFDVTDWTPCQRCGLPAGEHRPNADHVLACNTPGDLFTPAGVS